MKPWIRRLIFVAFLLTAIIVVAIEPISTLFGHLINLTASEKVNDIILIGTACLVYWYTEETAGLKRLQKELNDKTNKSIQEQRKQLFLELRPFIRLQWLEARWKHENEDRWWPGLATPVERSTSMVRLIDEWPGIRIINEGNGLAVNLDLTVSGKPTIHRSIVGGEKATKSYTDAGYSDTTLSSHEEFLAAFEPSKNYTVNVTYQDAAGNAYEQVFRSAKDLNDKYELLEWQVPRNFGKTSFDVVKVARK